MQSLAPSTRTTYRRALLLFSSHSQTSTPHSCWPYPATISQVISFITHLFSSNYAPSTVATMVSAVAFVNKLYQAPNPLHHFLIIKMLEGGRKAGARPDTRQPITLPLLHKLTASLPIFLSDQYLIILLKAMFLTAFHAFLRVGEFTVRSKRGAPGHTLQAADCSVHFTSGRPSSVSLRLTSYKHSQSTPTTITIPATHTSNCPVDTIHAYLQLARPQGGALFQFRDRQPVTRQYFQTQLHKALGVIGINITQFNTHSFRIGAATEAVSRLGLPDHEIQRLGRWSSNAFKSYIRSPHFTTPTS